MGGNLSPVAPQLWLKVVIQVAEGVAHSISWPLGHYNYFHSFNEYKKKLNATGQPPIIFPPLYFNSSVAEP